MALKYALNETEFAALPAVLQAEYTKQADGSYRLGVEGIDTAENLKGIIAKEKAEKAELRKRLDEQTAAEQAAETERLAKANEFKTLYETERKKAADLAAAVAEATARESLRLRTDEARSIAAGITKDEAKQALLIEKLLERVQHQNGAVMLSGEDGTTATKDTLAAAMRAKYPFLADGSNASGAGAPGGAGSGTAGRVVSRAEFNAMTPDARAELAKSRTVTIKD